MKTDTVVIDSQRFIRRAWPVGNSEFGSREHELLWYTMGLVLNEAFLQAMQDFIDPLVPDGFIHQGHENGFYIGRRFRHGEWSEVVRRRRKKSYSAGFGPEGEPLPSPSLRMREHFVRQRARAALELDKPLPGDGESPTVLWPVGARFRVDLDVEAHQACAPFLDPEKTIVYYDAPTLERFVVKVLDEIDNELPNLKPRTDKIRADLHWWIEHDAKHVPGVDDSWGL